MVPYRLILAVVFVGFFAGVMAAPVPKELKPSAGVIAVTRGGVVYLLTPDGKEVHKLDVSDRLKEERPDAQVSQVKGFPSPKSVFPLAVLVRWYQKTGEHHEYTDELRLIRKPGEPAGEVVDLDGEKLVGSRLVWARDGKRAYTNVWSTSADYKRGRKAQDKTLVIDPASGKATEAELPEGLEPFGTTAGGSLMGVATGGPGNDWPLRRVSADGKTVEKLKAVRQERDIPELDITPDGRTVLHRWLFSATGEWALTAFDAVSGEKTDIVPKVPGGKKLFVHSARWSPDGKRVGLVYSLTDDGRYSNEADRILHVCDRDGSNGSDIFTWSGKDEVGSGRFEWN